MKKHIYIVIMILSIVSCNSTSKIITTKKEAAKYQKLENNTSERIVIDSKTDVRKNSIKESEKKVIIDHSEVNVTEKSNSKNKSLVFNIIDEALQHIGVKYRAGGTNKDTGFDCSGLVHTSFKAHNISLPRSSHEMADFTEDIKKEDAKLGDLIYFKTNRSKRINHVGIITEINDDEIKFVHSSTQRGVIISSTKEPYYTKTFTKIGRVKNI